MDRAWPKVSEVREGLRTPERAEWTALLREMVHHFAGDLAAIARAGQNTRMGVWREVVRAGLRDEVAAARARATTMGYSAHLRGFGQRGWMHGYHARLLGPRHEEA